MTDTQREVKCPACGNIMHKVFIEEAGVNIDICVDGCGGMLFDNRELEKFDELHENAEEILKAVEGKEYPAVNDKAIRICPLCNTPMVKIGANGNVKIDVCNVCGAKFLDNDELKTIRQAAKVTDTKEEAMIKQLEAYTQQELYGELGKFLSKHIKATGGQKVVTNFVGSFLANLKNKD